MSTAIGYGLHTQLRFLISRSSRDRKTTGHGESLCETTYLVGAWELTQGTTEAPETKPQQELEVFKRRFYQTNSIFVGSCSRDTTLGLEWSTDPNSIWKHLEQQYQPLGIAQRFEAYILYGLPEPPLRRRGYQNVLPTVPGEAPMRSSIGHHPRRRSGACPFTQEITRILRPTLYASGHKWTTMPVKRAQRPSRWIGSFRACSARHANPTLFSTRVPARVSPPGPHGQGWKGHVQA